MFCNFLKAGNQLLRKTILNRVVYVAIRYQVFNVIFTMLIMMKIMMMIASTFERGNFTITDE